MASPPAPLAAADASATVPAAEPSLKPAILIIVGLVVVAVAAILLLRCLLRRWAASSSSLAHPRRAGGAARRPGVLAEREDGAVIAGAMVVVEEEEARRLVEADAVIAGAVVVEQEEEAEEVQAEPQAGADDDTERLIASLPLFTMASALAKLPKNSPDCAVCLSPFDPSADLRLLPACRHAFHAPCIDAWLRTNPVCPICRGVVSFPLPPLPVAAASGDQEPLRTRTSSSRRRSFRVELGSVSNRRSSAAGDQEPLGTRTSSRRRSFRVELGSVSYRRSSAAGEEDQRTYWLGGSFEYHVDDEVEAIVSNIVRPMAARPRPAAAAPGDALAEAVGPRGWLGEYDRVASDTSATSLSRRWSGRLSIDRWRHDDDWDPEAAAVAKSGGHWSWRWSQGNRHDELCDAEAPRRAEAEVEPALVALGRWIFGS